VKAYWIFITLLAALIVSGCTSAFSTTEVQATIPPTASLGETDVTQVPSGNSSGDSAQPMNTPDFSEVTPLPPEVNPAVKLAEEDLAGRLQISLDQIRFLKLSDIDWQDITQGCTSTPGETLTKGRVSGYRIWLEANGKNYLYHIGLDQTVFLCPE
jgi:hypothetical protein